MQYTQGESVTLAVAFGQGQMPRDQVVTTGAPTAQELVYAGTLVDPGAVVLRVVKPDGTEIDATYGVGNTIQRSGTGTYYAQIYLDQTGKWLYRFSGDAGTTVAKQGIGTFDVIQAAV